MAIYLSRQKGSGSATPITPSNASPVALVANNAVNPTTAGYAIESYGNVTPSNSSPVALTSGDIDKMGGNGYAIASYDSVTPSSTPESVSSGDIVKIGGSGVIVDAIPTPTSITPSNSNPVTLSPGNIYQPTSGGQAVKTVVNITPSNANPVQITTENTYYPSTSGLVILSMGSATPSDSNPATLSSNGIYRNVGSGNGYLYATKIRLPVFGDTPDKTFVNNTAGTSGTATISVTQKPRYIVYSMWSRTSDYRGFTGIIDVEQNKAYRMGYMASGAISESWTNWNNFFTTVSATQVIYAYNAVAFNTRVQIQIFY